MEKVTEIKLNTLCTIYSNCSMRVCRDVIIEKQTNKFINYVEKYDSWQHAPSQGMPMFGKFRKTEILHIEYHTK